MEESPKQSKFETRKIIEQRPFENPAAQSFFAIWCSANDSILPHIMSRSDWEKQAQKGLLVDGDDGYKILQIPSDVQLWEIVGIMEAVDHDTFQTNPRRQHEATERLYELAHTLEDAGVYIAQRLKSVHEGREIADALVQELYQYGRLLETGKKEESSALTDDIAKHELSKTDLDTIDRFLAGDTLYESRRKRAEEAAAGDSEKIGQYIESEREKTLSQFFRVAAKAFELQRRGNEGKLDSHADSLAPWQERTPIHNVFIQRVEQSLKEKIEMPRTELNSAIFRRGMDLLRTKMPFDKLPQEFKEALLYWENGEKTLREALKMDILKKNLENTRLRGTPEEIQSAELDTAHFIQAAVASYTYNDWGNHPSEMVLSQTLNCVGASSLGGALMQEAGLTYVVGEVPEHSILLLVTSDGTVEWLDMLHPDDNEEITNETIRGTKKNGDPLGVDDIVAFARAPSPHGLLFTLEGDSYRKKLKWVKEGQNQFVCIFGPEDGQKIQVFENMGAALMRLAKGEKEQALKDEYYAEAAESYEAATAVGVEHADPYVRLGNSYMFLKKFDEAAAAYRKAISINPKDAYPYKSLGDVFYVETKYNEAIELYLKAVEADPSYIYPYFDLGNVYHKTGKYDEAIQNYQIFIDLADQKENAYWINMAEKNMESLREYQAAPKAKKKPNPKK